MGYDKVPMLVGVILNVLMKMCFENLVVLWGGCSTLPLNPRGQDQYWCTHYPFAYLCWIQRGWYHLHTRFSEASSVMVRLSQPVLRQSMAC